MNEKREKSNVILRNPVIDYVRRNIGILIGLLALVVFLSVFTDSFCRPKICFRF